MSKFLNNLTTHDLHKVKLSPMGLKGSTSYNIEDLAPGITTGMLHSYVISVNWTMYAECLPQNLPEVEKNIHHQLQNEIYGDLRERIYKLERAMYARDIDAMESALRDIKKEVGI
jgi:hypothetical protein